MKKKLSSVLLIDDDRETNFFHKIILKKCGITENVLTALNGEEGLSLLRTHIEKGERLPELLLLDINMPGMNGWEFLEEYDKLDAAAKTHVAIVMLSASINPDDEKRALSNKHVRKFCQKNLSDEAVFDIVDECLT